MDAMQALKEWVGNNNADLADWAAEAESYTNDLMSGAMSQDEYEELMEDLKRSDSITKAADDLAVRSKAVELLDDLIAAVKK